MIYKGNKELENLYKGSEENESVWLGTKEVWTNSLGSLVDLGVGTSFDIKTLLPNYYAALTANNFYLYSIEGYNGGGGSTSQHMASDATSSSSLVKSYNATTGVLTCYNQMNADWRASDQTRYSNKNTNCGVKVFVPKSKIADSKKVIKMISLGNGQSFDISQVYSGYKNLTANDFFISSYDTISDHEHGGTSTSSSAYLNLSIQKSYDANTGMLSISCHSDISGSRVHNTNVNCHLLRNK